MSILLAPDVSAKQGSRSPAGDVTRMRLERGPDWLFVHVESGRDGCSAGRDGLADAVWEAVRESHVHRVLLELDEAGPLDDDLIATITTLGSRVRGQGGMIRICGLSGIDLRMLRARGAAAEIAHFGSRSEAVGVPRPAASR